MSQAQLSYDNLLKLGDIETSENPFVAKVRSIQGREQEIVAVLAPDEPAQSKILDKIAFQTLTIELSDRCAGFGYASSNENGGSDKEALISSFIVSAFKASGMKVEPLLLSVVDYYSYQPEKLSLVGKTKSITREEFKENGKPQHAIVLSDFSNSDLFSARVMTEIPCQDALGLAYNCCDEKLKSFGERLRAFSYEQLPLIVEENGGINQTVATLSEATSATSEDERHDLKMLLATSLLLQDRQMWQDLWYETGTGVPLFIVAPKCFHDAMNRVNLAWGHGSVDYHYRAGNSLEASDASLFEGIEPAKEKIIPYREQGMNATQVMARLEPMLARLEKARSFSPNP
ncbi:MAG: hypothetical protein PHW76_08610 [Alphaproteobacteria bacterium]|nr:hypothetical protein [Alphaproteobacteria bacterium]